MIAADLARTPADIEAMRKDAWAGFVSDYTLAIDADPGEARVRFRKRMAAIDAIEQQMMEAAS